MMVEGENQKPPPGEAYSSSDDASAFPDPWVIEAMPEELYDAPLDFIFADHHRQRQAALILHLIADGKFNRRGVADLIEFLEVDFALHVGDEELGFFPILRQRCAPEDEIDVLIKRLAEEHKTDEVIGDEALKILKGLIAGRKLQTDDRRRLRVFSKHIRQHLAIENAVLLPIARVRMDETALHALSETLKQRHARRGSGANR